MKRSNQNRENPDKSVAREEIVDQLREAIIKGIIKPGQELNQVWLARRFGTSRLPVREAVQQLGAEGLVYLEPYRRARVADLSAERLREFFAIRTELESLALRHAVPRLNKKDFEVLEALLVRFKECEAQKNFVQWIKTDREFHRYLTERAGMDFLLELVERVRDHVQRYLRVMDIGVERMADANEEHMALVEACRRGHATEAELLLRVHLYRAREALMSSSTFRSELERSSPAAAKPPAPEPQE